MNKKPNIILMMVDQMRADFLGYNGNEHIDTPSLDMMAHEGFNFTNAYAGVPTCIPARASLMTGMKQGNHGRVGYEDGVDWTYENMLPEVFSKNGYHTYAVGKMHVFPDRNLAGFNSVVLHNGYLHESRKYKRSGISQFEATDDYLKWIKEELGHKTDLIDLGIGCNSWLARPFEQEEKYHPTNWAISESIDFLERKDPTKPFFLKMSLVRPHAPYDPPQFYYDLYKNRDVKEPVIGKWHLNENKNRDDYNIDTLHGVLKTRDILAARRSYSALITHIDHQISRFLFALDEHGETENTIILFTSDHGDMLGDHNFYRKGVPYEGGVNVPLFVYDPGNLLNAEQSKVFSEVLELRDIMPTLLDFAGLDIPETVDGLSVKPLIKNEEIIWRDYIHGEHNLAEFSNHYITNGKQKYIWYSQTGIEQFFDLEKDPEEIHNLINDPSYQDQINQYKAYLIDELKDREEGYSDGKQLIVGKPPQNILKEVI